MYSSSNQYVPSITPVCSGDKVEKTNWQTLLNFSFQWSVDGDMLLIPAGFKFDGASIPAIFWFLLMLHPFSPRIVTAALVHDFCYRNRFDRKVADKLFYRKLRLHGINKFRAWLMWLGVRSVGWVFYLPKDNWLKKVIGWVL